MVLEKKMAAAMAAVMTYIKSEEEMVLAQAAAGGGVQPAARPSVAINLWGLSGRQAMMQMRNQMQMRGFHGARLR